MVNVNNMVVFKSWQNLHILDTHEHLEEEEGAEEEHASVVHHIEDDDDDDDSTATDCGFGEGSVESEFGVFEDFEFTEETHSNSSQSPAPTRMNRNDSRDSLSFDCSTEDGDLDIEDDDGGDDDADKSSDDDTALFFSDVNRDLTGEGGEGGDLWTSRGSNDPVPRTPKKVTFSNDVHGSRSG